MVRLFTANKGIRELMPHGDFGPGHTGQIFVYFAKTSVTSFLRQVRPVIFRSTKFYRGLPNFRDAVVLPRSKTNFCQAWNLTDLSIYTPWFEGKCQSIKFEFKFSRSISIRSPPKLFLSYAAIKRWRWKIRTSECCITILTQNTTIMVPKFTFQLHLQGQVLFNLYRLK